MYFPHTCSCAAVKARGTDLRVHYKQTREIAAAVHGMHLKKAILYLRDVVEFKRIIPFRVHTGGIGRHAQARYGGGLWGLVCLALYARCCASCLHRRLWAARRTAVRERD